MPTSQSQLVEVLKEQIASLEARSPGYRARVADALGRIIYSEQRNKVRRIDIRQEVKKECIDLGTFLFESRAEAPVESPASEGSDQ
jgi:ribosomal protein L34